MTTVSKRMSLDDIKYAFEKSGVFQNLAAGGKSSPADGTGVQRPYKIYTVQLTQTGTTAPVDTVLENSLGEVVLARTGVGVYTATLTGAFTQPGTTLQVMHSGTGIVTATRTSANVVTINTYSTGTTAADAILANTGLEVRVYPGLDS